LLLLPTSAIHTCNVSRWPPLAAAMRAVSPPVVACCSSHCSPRLAPALLSSSSCTAAVAPLAAAWMRGVAPTASRWLMSAPYSSSSWHMGTCALAGQQPHALTKQADIRTNAQSSHTMYCVHWHAGGSIADLYLNHVAAAVLTSLSSSKAQHIHTI
jgi:hypothetical protein